MESEKVSFNLHSPNIFLLAKIFSNRVNNLCRLSNCHSIYLHQNPWASELLELCLCWKFVCNLVASNSFDEFWASDRTILSLLPLFCLDSKLNFLKQFVILKFLGSNHSFLCFPFRFFICQIYFCFVWRRYFWTRGMQCRDFTFACHWIHYK